MTIDKSMNIVEILRINEGIADILMASGMHCLGCPSSRGETIAQACYVHGTDADALLAKQGKYYELWNLQQGIFRDKKRGSKPAAPVSAAKVVEDEDDGESITY